MAFYTDVTWGFLGAFCGALCALMFTLWVSRFFFRTACDVFEAYPKLGVACGVLLLLVFALLAGVGLIEGLPVAVALSPVPGAAGALTINLGLKRIRIERDARADQLAVSTLRPRNNPTNNRCPFCELINSRETSHCKRCGGSLLCNFR